MRYILFVAFALPFITSACHIGHTLHCHSLSRHDHVRKAYHTQTKSCNTPSRHTKHSRASHPATRLWSNIKGILDVKSSCGEIGATKQVTATSGPNGSEDWLNCGINAGGWHPPNVTVEDLVTEDLSQAIRSPGSPFRACGPYVRLFHKYAKEYRLPSIVLAALALQESSCKSDRIGGAGEQGLMQITKDKCGGAPGGNCRDPDFNVRTGAKYFADTLGSNGGNIIATIGMYNGWRVGMTHAEAIAAGSSSCCRCQNNLDYIHQFVNGWLQNKDAHTGTPRLGIYFNLDKCGH